MKILHKLRELFRRTDIEAQAHRPPLVILPTERDNTVSLNSSTARFTAIREQAE